VLHLVQDELKRLDRLVSDFLAFARPTPLSLQTTDVSALVTRVLDLIRPECDALHIRLDVDLSESGAIQADEERLRQVLLNIVRNGMEALRDNGRLTVRTLGPNAAGNVCVEIADDGPGFPEDAPVFDAFFTTKQQGTGLGLAIAHSIVRDHGGSIGVESRPGRTVFRVSLPEAIDSERERTAQGLHQ
jgi:signal transduction histidine kinase